MNDREEKCVDLEGDNSCSDAAACEPGIDAEKQVHQPESNTVYGAVYSPDADGKAYACQHYSVVSGVDCDFSKTEVEKTEIQKPNEKIKRRPRKTLTAIVIGVSVCLILSAISAFIAAYMTSNYYEAYNGNSNAEQNRPQPPTSGNNHIFIDDSKPSFTTQNKTPGEKMTMEEAILSVKDSVVEITTERVQNGYGGYSQYVVSGAGSGVIISTGGYIITNNHVIDGASNIIVRLTNGKEYNATLIAIDVKTDLAIISITPESDSELTTAVIGSSSSLNLGQTVIAIGNPLGKLGGTVTNGIISSLAREISIEGSGTITLLQTNAAVSPGNSGGGLFDLYGRLIGIVNAKSSGDGVEGISFAIPIDTAWDVAQQLIDKGYVSGRPSIGVLLKEVQYGYSIFGDSYYQVVIAESSEDGALKANDVILSIDKSEISTISDVSYIVLSHKIGDKIVLTVKREKRIIEVVVTLKEYSPDEINAN